MACTSRRTLRQLSITTTPTARGSSCCIATRSSGCWAGSSARARRWCPTRIYFKGPRAKVELAVAKGKEQRDRRREIRDRDVARDVERELADRNR